MIGYDPQRLAAWKRMAPDETVTAFPPQTPLAMAYVPMQAWEAPYEDPADGFHKGTIFPSLYFPFMGGKEEGGSYGRKG